MPTCFLRPYAKRCSLGMPYEVDLGSWQSPGRSSENAYGVLLETEQQQQKTKKSLTLGIKQYRYTTMHHVTPGLSAQTPFE